MRESELSEELNHLTELTTLLNMDEQDTDEIAVEGDMLSLDDHKSRGSVLWFDFYTAFKNIAKRFSVFIDVLRSNE